MSKSESRGDDWKDVVSNPGHEQGLPIRPTRICVEAYYEHDSVTFETTNPGERIVASECVNLEDKQ